MPLLTLNQAAKEAGKAKSTILDAIKSGRLSAPKGEKGQYEIDPAELFRVFPKTGSEPVEKTATDHLENHQKTALLLQKIDFLEQRIEDIKRNSDDLRHERDRLLKIVEEQAGAVKQLTWQPKTDPEPAPTTPIWQWWLIFALIVSGASVWFWWTSH